MNYKDFKEKFIGDVKSKLLSDQGTDVDITINKMNKLNESYEAMTVKPEGSNIGVNIAVDKLFKAMKSGASYDEVIDKAIAWQTTKFSVKGMFKFLQGYMAERKRQLTQGKVTKDTHVKGKQTVKQLVGQGQGVSTMEIAGSGIRDFKRISNKYGLDFAVTKDKSVDPPLYTVFFKTKDDDAITSVLKEYAVKQTKRKKSLDKDRPSILQKLKKFKEIVANTIHKPKEHKKELDR